MNWSGKRWHIWHGNKKRKDWNRSPISSHMIFLLHSTLSQASQVWSYLLHRHINQPHLYHTWLRHTWQSSSKCQNVEHIDCSRQIVWFPHNRAYHTYSHIPRSHLHSKLIEQKIQIIANISPYMHKLLAGQKRWRRKGELKRLSPVFTVATTFFHHNKIWNSTYNWNGEGGGLALILWFRFNVMWHMSEQLNSSIIVKSNRIHI